MGKHKLFSVDLHDCDVTTMTAGGPGGQHQNRSQTAIRIVHRASGAVGVSREHRSQLQNKKAAFRRMTEHPKFKVWLNKKIYEIDGKIPVEQQVTKEMIPDNLKVEVKKNGRWEVVD